MVKSSGFTLVELLIVIAVIGILAGGIISLVNPVAQFQKANDSRRKADLAQIQKAFETFYQDNGKYPDSSRANDSCEGGSNPCPYRIKGIDANNPIRNWGQSWLPYMGTLPKDPSSSKKYVYNSTSNGQTYCIYASLDREVTITNFGSCFPSGATCGTGSGVVACNYGVSSPNVSP